LLVEEVRVALEYAVALGGGLVSFLSPCVLPLLPVYLSISTGLEVRELEAGGRRQATAVLRGCGLFVAGFSVVFVALGSSATALGALLAGTWWSAAPASRDLRFHPGRLRWGLWGAPVSGAAFAFGWTPCIGPVLGSVLTVAAAQGRALEGGLLLLVYSAGLGIPFLLTGLAFSRGLRGLRWPRRHGQVLVRGSALVLTGYGVLLAVGGLPHTTALLQQAVLTVHLGRLLTLG
jgi:cytochrome c-type biogenesis protein